MEMEEVGLPIRLSNVRIRMYKMTKETYSIPFSADLMINGIKRGKAYNDGFNDVRFYYETDEDFMFIAYHLDNANKTCKDFEWKVFYPNFVGKPFYNQSIKADDYLMLLFEQWLLGNQIKKAA